jgi:hypothetical protein
MTHRPRRRLVNARQTDERGLASRQGHPLRLLVIALAAASCANAAIAQNTNTVGGTERRPDHARRLIVENSTNHTLVNIYASTSPTFHGDWLPQKRLAPGDRVVMDFNDGSDSCVVQVKAVFDDGSNQVRTVDICTAATLKYTQ